MKLMGILAGILLYLEVVYHLGCFGFTACNPVFALALVLIVGALEALAVGCVKAKRKRMVFTLCLAADYLLFAVQLVYMGIFKQPLQWEAMIRGGQDALTNYWREALEGILSAAPFLVLMAVPGIVLGMFFGRKKEGGKRYVLPVFEHMDRLRVWFGAGVGMILAVTVMLIGKYTEADYYESYTEFFDPLTVAEEMGVLAMVQRDTAWSAETLARDVVKYVHAREALQVADAGYGQSDGDRQPGGEEQSDGGRQPGGEGQSESGRQSGGEGQSGSGRQPDGGGSQSGGNGQSGSGSQPGDGGSQSGGSGQPGSGSQPGDGGSQSGGNSQPGNGSKPGDGDSQSGSGSQLDDGNGQPGSSTGEQSAESQEPDTSPNELPIDFEVLQASANNTETAWLAEYLQNTPATARNEYTGIFEGYNLIFLTAEGFSPYAVREDLTPTLYRLIHSGFDFTNYYVPLWQTSTSDGEYVNCTGLIPDGQFSMRKSGSNALPFALPGFFASEGAGSLAYHNNSLDYYDRHVSHNNLGYVFKAAKLGNLSESQWGQYIFPMENPDSWPASDLEMMEGTIPEYIGQDRFNVYYLTVSGHMNYSFRGNSMSLKNRDAVSALDLSETAKAYIACQTELDRALSYLLLQLEEAGKLENTVICLSADHYPYGMKQEDYEELAGRSLSENMDLYRNNLIIWNVKLEENPKVVDKVCCSVDILPTLLNLFGFSYDSRLYAGRDIFSEEEGLVIFNDRSFVTDQMIYNRKTKQTIWTGEGEAAEEDRSLYQEQIKQVVKDRYQFSAYVLRNDYYSQIQQALPAEYQNTADNPLKGQESAP